MTTKTDIPSSSSPPPFRKLTYDVFLSFRGEDTRKNFTDHLYAALKQNGIHTFRDDEELERGKSIAPELFTAIEESRYVIVVLSRNYANSSWCLDEIAKIVECMKETVVLPVFYDVDPSDVRKQTGHLEEAFSQHEEAFKDEPDKVTRWRRALFQVANLSGWNLRDGYETKVIGEIVEKIFTKLNERISTSEGLVGMDSHLKKMLSYLDIGHPDVRIIGISGMGGIGKTTIAHMVSQRVKGQFEGNSFLENIREVIEKHSPAHLQEKLLSNLLKSNVNVQDTEMGKDIIRHRLRTKRVLIVLDDVDQDEQLEALCDRKWFGPGSRIILTSRDEQLFRAFEVDEVYKVNSLSDADALQLFHMKAFKKDQLVGEEFLKLSKDFLKYADGHPLAIKVLGSSVKGRSVELWSSALDRLKHNPETKIINVFKLSFEGLRDTEKEIFLDIACFFKGYDRDRVTRILQGCNDYCPNIDIVVLIEKSMVTLFGRKLWMHDLIQTMGREIVCQEYPKKPEKRSRLWVPKEIIHVLDQSKARSAIESILLQGPTKDNVVHSINDSFSNMDKLRLLNISNVKFSGNIKNLSNELQYLEWDECPLGSFPSDFQPDNLVELLMYSSRIKQLWRGEKGWRMLRLINLSGSQYLTSTPDFTQVPDLEILELKDCTSLVEVHPSLGFLKKLIRLNMRNCQSVESIPPFTSLESLKTLNLSLCSRLKMFPKIEGNMKSLLELYLGGTSIEKLPPSVERLTGLTTLNLTGCSKIVEIPENLNCMESLEQLDIGGTAIRDSSFLVGMKNLKSLFCRGCKGDAPRSLLSPASLPSLTSLIDLNLSYCNLMDGDIPDDLSSLISLRELDLSGNCFIRLPESFSQVSKLETLYLRNCKQLELVPKKLPFSLDFVYAQDCTSLTDYPNQIKVLTSVESGVTVVNSLLNSSTFGYLEEGGKMWHLNGGESTELILTSNKQTEVLSFSLPRRVYLKELESALALQSMSHDYYGCYAGNNEIPEWFNNTSTRNPISIPIGDKKWKGVATCAVISVNTTADVDFSNYWYQITLETDAVSLKPFVIDKGLRKRSDRLLIYYSPISRFSKRELNESTVVRARFETNNPFVVVQKCGIRLAYEQDAGWLSRLPTKYEGKCFSCENNAVLLAGWLSRGDKWEKFIPPLEEEYTHVLRKNIESVLLRYLEALNHSAVMYKFNLSGTPAWFHNEVSFFGGIQDRYHPYNAEGTDVMMFADVIEIPQNLHKSKKWMGFAIQASIAEVIGAEEEKEDNYCVYLQLITGPEIHSTKLIGEIEYVHNVGKIATIRSSHDQLLVVYIPRAQIPEALFATSTTKMLVFFVINSRHVEIRKIGVRVVYQQDIRGFSDAIIKCIQKDGSLEIYDKLVVENWLELIRLKGGHSEKDFALHSKKYRNWDNAVRQSGWLSPGDKCLNWEKFIPPSEEEYSTHVLRKNIESVLPRYLEALNHGSAIYKFNLSGTPAWFHNVVGFFTQAVEGTDKRMFRMPIEIPQNLHKCKKWMGFAIQASIAVEEKEDKYRVDLILINQSEKNLNLTTGTEYHHVGQINIEYMRSSHDQLLVVYIPRAQLPEVLFAETSTTQMLVCFLINSPHVKFRTIGARVVYQQDIQGFADAIIHCMQRENSFELNDKLVVEDCLKLIRLQGGHLEGMSNPKERDSRTRREKEFELHSQKYRNWDWSAPHPVCCDFFGAEISKWKWFMHIQEGDSAEIPLPPNLLDDANWLGIAICAFSRLCPKDPNMSLGGAVCDSEYNVFTCRLDCGGHVLGMGIPYTEFDASGLAKDVTWFVYIPRGGKWFKSWRQGKLARATLSWSSQYLAMQSCALGLVYKEDVERLVQTLTSCELP